MNQRSIALTIAFAIASIWAMFLIWLQLPIVIAILVMLSSISGGILLIFNVLRRSVNQPAFEAGVLPITIALTLFIPIILSIYGSVKVRGSAERVPVAEIGEENAAEENTPPSPPSPALATSAAEIIQPKGGEIVSLEKTWWTTVIAGKTGRLSTWSFAGMLLEGYSMEMAAHREMNGQDADIFLVSANGVAGPQDQSDLEALSEKKAGRHNYAFKMQSGEPRRFYGVGDPAPLYAQIVGENNHRLKVSLRKLLERDKGYPGKEVNFQWYKATLTVDTPLEVTFSNKVFREFFAVLLPDEDKGEDQIPLEGFDALTNDGQRMAGISWKLNGTEPHQFGRSKAFTNASELYGQTLSFYVNGDPGASLTRDIVFGVIWDK